MVQCPPEFNKVIPKGDYDVGLVRSGWMLPINYQNHAAHHGYTCGTLVLLSALSRGKMLQIASFSVFLHFQLKNHSKTMAEIPGKMPEIPGTIAEIPGDQLLRIL